MFDGIDLQAAIQRFQPSLTDKTTSKKGQTKSESGIENPATLVLEAIYLKSLSLQKLGKSTGTHKHIPLENYFFVAFWISYVLTKKLSMNMQKLQISARAFLIQSKACSRMVLLTSNRSYKKLSTNPLSFSQRHGSKLDHIKKH